MGKRNEDELNADVLQPLTRHRLARQIEFFAELDSTNNYALQLCRDHQLLEPHLIVAQRQWAGRGRGANSWWAEPGALTFSLAIPATVLDLPIEHLPKFSLTTGLAISESLQRLIPQASLGLKWPNDVYLNGRKVCGVLIEVPQGTDSALGAAADTKQPALIVGIGVNVNNSIAHAPPDLQSTAVALCDVTLRRFSLRDVLQELLLSIETRLDDLRDHPQRVLDRWQQLCLLTGQTIQLTLESEQVTGVCRGINAQGGLVLETAAGTKSLYGGVIGSQTLPREP